MNMNIRRHRRNTEALTWAALAGTFAAFGILIFAVLYVGVPALAHLAVWVAR